MINHINNETQRKTNKVAGMISLSVVIFTSCIFLTVNLIAQEQKIELASSSNASSKKANKAINMCPGGIALGIFSINYEHLFGQSHGMVIRFDYEDIPNNYTDAKIKANGVAFILNYRWHKSKGLKSGYLGAYARYRIYHGTGKLESAKFDFTIPELTLGLNIGKRWIWKSGFNLNLAFGYGFSIKSRTADPSNPSVESTINKFEDAYDFIDPFLGEFSIGYAF
jgi:hypothetical protein